MNSKFELGIEVRDKITHFKGTVIGRAEYITGCDQYLVLPKMKPDEDKYPTAEWFDSGRLESVENGEKIKSSDLQDKKPGACGEAPKK